METKSTIPPSVSAYYTQRSHDGMETSAPGVQSTRSAETAADLRQAVRDLCSKADLPPELAEHLLYPPFLADGGCTLNFNQLPEPTKTIGDLPVDVLGALDELAKLDGGPGVTRLVMPTEAFKDNQSAYQAVTHLEGVKHLELQAATPDSVPDRLYLHTIEPHGRALNTIISAPSGLPLTFSVTTSPGMHVHANNTPVSLRKHYVHTLDSEGKSVGKPRALGGEIYYRRPDEKLVARLGLEQAELRAGLNLNMEASFDTKKVTTREDTHQIVCRDLSQRRSELLHDHQQAKASAASTDLKSKPRFSYEPLSSEEQIKKNVPLSVRVASNNYDRFIPTIYHSTANFGRALAQLFHQKDAPLFRELLLRAPVHDLRVEMKMTQGQPTKYAVTLYDSNRTATHKRVTVTQLEELEKLSLEDWLEKDPKLGITDAMSKYFGNGPDRITCLSSPQDDKSTTAASPAILLGEQDRKSPAFLQTCMLTGDVDNVQKFIADTLKDDSLSMSEKCVRLWGGVNGSSSALVRAVTQGALRAVPAYVHGVLAAAKQGAIEPGQASGLLRGLSFTPSSTGTLNPLRIAEPHSRTDAVPTLITAMLEGDFEVLAYQKIGTLVAEDSSGNTMLHQLATQRASLAPLDTPPDPQRVIRYLQPILESPKLSLVQKQQIIAISNRQTKTAAQSAMEGNIPTGAGAMILAILDSRQNKTDTQALLNALNVELPRVLQRLDSTPHGGAEMAEQIKSQAQARGLHSVFRLPVPSDGKGTNNTIEKLSVLDSKTLTVRQQPVTPQFPMDSHFKPPGPQLVRDELAESLRLPESELSWQKKVDLIVSKANDGKGHPTSVGALMQSILDANLPMSETCRLLIRLSVNVPATTLPKTLQALWSGGPNEKEMAVKIASKARQREPDVQKLIGVRHG